MAGDASGARHLWKVGTWEPGPDLGGLIAGFSEDGRLVAVDDLVGSVHLLDPDTGREYVRLEHPQGFVRRALLVYTRRSRTGGRGYGSGRRALHGVSIEFAKP